MPRRPRIALAGFPLHIIQRGNNRSACFFSDDDRGAYLYWLRRYAERFDVQIHAWVLMTNHVHLLTTPSTPGAASRVMQALGRRYVRTINHLYRRTGTLWEGRFKACAVHAEEYLFHCMRYIELNPVRAAMVSAPGEYRWSSYRRNAMGHDDVLVTAHPLYVALGQTPRARCEAYYAQFDTHVDNPGVAEIRSATAAGHLLAGESFRAAIEMAHRQRLGPAPLGRPRNKEARDGSQLDLPDGPPEKRL